MRFNPSEFIQIASELSNIETSESYNRSVINRAYYGAFGYIKENLPGYFDNSTSIHRDVIRSLKDSPHKNEIKAGNTLEQLFKMRKKADYNYGNQSFKTSGCKLWVEQAKLVINLFDNLETETT